MSGGRAWCLRAFATHSRQKTLYETLEVQQDAKQAEIKSQFYELSKKFHPDKNPGNEAAHEKFLKISEAYSTLSDATTRRQYDRTLSYSRPTTSGAGSSRPHGTGPRPTTFRSKLRPDDWILHRSNSGPKSKFYDYEAHQQQHYQEYQENKDMQARMASMLRRKRPEADSLQGNLMIKVVLLGTGLFLFLQSGMVKLLFMDHHEQDEAIDRDFPSLESNYIRREPTVTFSTPHFSACRNPIPGGRGSLR
ncbi:hypothetical protein HDU67_006370 [Dinochytrium kinnereticum]|nr:hypothetical protein HDU67_006370 [Dinochytrium kinnereticum]